MQIHTFHLVDPSPWPICASISVWAFITGLIGYFYNYEYSGLLAQIGLIGIIYVSMVWWRDVFRESIYFGHHTKKVKKGLWIGFILFVISEFMLFFSAFWAFAHSATSPIPEISGIWPPEGIDGSDALSISLLNTIILLCSGVTINLAHTAVYEGKKKKTLWTLGLTILLGLLFTYLQIAEYLASEYSISDSIYGSIFYFLTGLHGFHVIIGSFFLIICFVRMLVDDYELNPSSHLGFEFAAFYWHFVDFIWLLVIIVVYYWGN